MIEEFCVEYWKGRLGEGERGRLELQEIALTPEQLYRLVFYSTFLAGPEAMYGK
jgi:hypothetical protein